MLSGGEAKMKKLLLIVPVLLIAGMLQAEDVTVESMPPSVVKTVPASGDRAVDASLKEIAVTFSKNMMTEQMWSWCIQTKETFPEIDVSKKVRFLKDKRTCVLPVKLQPGKTYAIWINSKNNNNFKDTGKRSAVPYLLVFRTRK